MSRISRLAAAVVSADRSRERINRTGFAPSGAPIWSPTELDLLKQNHPDYRAAMQALGGRRTYSAVRHKAQKLGLAPKRNHWTAEQVSRLRKLYRRSATTAELLEAFPNWDLQYLHGVASYFKIKRPRKRYVPTGFPIIDQIRDRCFELCLSMPDLDAMAGTGKYFATAGWHSGRLKASAVARAVKALEGDLVAIWNEDDRAPARTVIVPFPPVRRVAPMSVAA